MALAEIDPLILELRADVRGFGNELTQAQRVADARLGAIERSGTKMSRSLSSGFNLAKGAAVGFIASLGVDAVVQAVKAGLDYASSLGEVAQQLGVTTDALQEYRYAGSQAGLATEEVDQALSQLTRRIGEAASGTKAQAEAFEKLGVSVKDANGNIIDAGDAIPEIADALQKIESPAERAAILMDLFGRAGQKLEPLLSGGAKGVNELRDSAQKLGIVLSSQQIAKADETADKLDAVRQVLAAKIAGTVADNADAILALADALSAVVGGAGKAIDALNQFYKVVANRPGNLFEKITGTNFSTGAPIRTADFQAGRVVTAQANKAAATARGEVFGPQKRRGGFRSNFAAQSDPFQSFADELTPPIAAAAALGPNKNQAKAIEGVLNAGQQELLAIFVELNSVAAELIGTLESRVEAEKIQIEADKITSIDRINANDELTAAQKEQARQGIEAVAAGKIELANARLAAEAAENAADLADIEARNALAALEDQYDLATSIAERARIAQQIVETETQAALDAVDAQLLSEDITDAKREQLEAIRRGIVAEGATNQRKAAEGNRSASGTELDRLNKLNFGDEAEKFGVDALKDLNAGLADAIVNGGNLGDVLEDTGKRFLAQLIELTFQLLVIKPLLESLGGSSGGGIGSALGSLFGGTPAFANGTKYAQGGRAIVGERGPEIVNLPRGSQVIPNSLINSQANRGGQSGGMSVIRLELSGDIEARMTNIAAGVTVQAIRTAEPALTNKAVAETFRRGQRPSIGAR